MLVGLIPAAGHATRLGPQAGSKEMLRVRGRPMIDHLVSRLRVVDPDELRVVTRPEKEDVTRHAVQMGARVIHGHPSEVAASLLLGIEGLADDDEVLFGFPDSLWEPADGFAPVLARLRAGVAVALGLFRLTEGLERSDVVTMGEGHRIAGVSVKPDQPPGDLIWGIAGIRAGLLRQLPHDGEPGTFFDEIARRDVVSGVELSSEWLDVGTPEALQRARES